MNFIQAGRGTPPLVFVHGFGCSHEDWAGQIAHFEKAHHCVACDLRGHGATPGRPHECSIAHYGGDVAALIHHLDLKHCILVGHSMGCRVALEANRLAPDRIGGLVLIDGSRQASGDPDAAEAGIRSTIASVGFAAFRDNAFRGMFFQWSSTADRLLARVRAMDEETGAALWTRMVRWDAEHMEAALEAVRAPLMAIQSTTIDPATRKRTPLRPGDSTPFLKVVRDKVPQARIEILPGVGHFAQIEAADAVNRLLAEFLQKKNRSE